MVEELTNKEKLRIAIILCFLLTVTLSSLDIYLPAIKNAAAYFSTTKNKIQLSISLYLLGFAISQVFYGIISDFYGRKKIMVLGLFIGLIGNAFCIFSDKIEMFLLYRFIAGIGDSVVFVLQRSISREIYQGKKLVVLASFIAFSWALTLALSPILGGYLEVLWGWRSNFIFITIYHILALIIVVLFLKETASTKKFNFENTKMIINDYLAVFKNRSFLIYVMITSISFAGFLGYNALSPFIFMELFNLNPIFYGDLGIYICIAYLIATGVNSIMAPKYGINKMIASGIIFMLIGGILVGLVALLDIVNISIIMTTITIYIVGMGFTCPNATVGALTALKNNFGIASSVYGSIQMLIGAIVANFSVILFIPNLYVMSGLFIFLSLFVLSLFIGIVYYKGH